MGLRPDCLQGLPTRVMSRSNSRPVALESGAGLISEQQARYPMRAEMEAIVDEIKQAISLLRRHL